MIALTVESIASLLEGPSVWHGLTRPTGDGESPPGGVPSPTAALRPPGNSPRPNLSVGVVWGDLVHQPADIHVVGHYQGVLPTSAEAALDRVISTDPHRGLIADHTRRRWLVGTLGEISFFPGGRDGDAPSAVRQVAVAGMGRPGTFQEANAQQLYASLLRELSVLPGVHVAAMALIGSGSANLDIPRVARSIIRGFAAVVDATTPPANLPDIVFVERDRLRADRLAIALQSTSVPSVQVHGQVETGTGGAVHRDAAAVFAVRAVAQALRREKIGAGEDETAANLHASLAAALPEQWRDLVVDRLADISDDLEALEVHVGVPSGPQEGRPPTRLSVTHHVDTETIDLAALTDRATVPERQVPIRRDLVAELTSRLTAPLAEDGKRLAPMLRRWVMPSDFQNHICADAPLVLEVNGAAALFPWEFLTDEAFETGEQSLPLALRTPIARQLRTTYATSTVEPDDNEALTALVIADPGARQYALPGARAEGLEVAALLQGRGVRTKVYIGSPDNPPPAGALMATQLDVLNELLTGRFDIVHYAGHGLMPQPDRPSTAGWLFSDGVLAARELAQLTEAPRLVVANACWTAAGVGSATGTPAASAGRAQLNAVLAEEFLRAGVTHYIGTSWAVPDDMARLFATSVYDDIVPPPGRLGQPIGPAVMDARKALFTSLPPLRGDLPSEKLFAWAAYQHYGDPADVFHRMYSPAEDDGSD